MFPGSPLTAVLLAGVVLAELVLMALAAGAWPAAATLAPMV